MIQLSAYLSALACSGGTGGWIKKAFAFMDCKSTLTLYELYHVSMLLPDPETYNENEYRFTYHYDIEHAVELKFIRMSFSDRSTWIFTGNVILPPLFSIELT